MLSGLALLATLFIPASKYNLIIWYKLTILFIHDDFIFSYMYVRIKLFLLFAKEYFKWIQYLYWNKSDS